MQIVNYVLDFHRIVRIFLRNKRHIVMIDREQRFVATISAKSHNLLLLLLFLLLLLLLLLLFVFFAASHSYYCRCKQFNDLSAAYEKFSIVHFLGRSSLGSHSLRDFGERTLDTFITLDV